MLCLQFLLWLLSVDFLSNLRNHQLHLSAKAHPVFTLLFHVLQLFNYQYLCLNHLFKVFWHHSELEVSRWLYIYHHSYWWDIHSIGVHIHVRSSRLYSQTQWFLKIVAQSFQQIILFNKLKIIQLLFSREWIILGNVHHLLMFLRLFAHLFHRILSKEETLFWILFVKAFLFSFEKILHWLRHYLEGQVFLMASQLISV
jgi:hypothetical protein